MNSLITNATAAPYDVAICGGGLVGASLALMLAQLDLRVLMLEAFPFGTGEQPSFDERTTALSNGSRRIFEAIGVWNLISRAATPIKRIHVSDQGRFGFARLNAEEQGLAQLGHVVLNRVMGEALWRRLQSERIEVVAPAKVVGLGEAGDHRAIGALTHNEQNQDFAAHLVVAADGAQSTVRAAANIQVNRRDYGQVAIVTNASAQRFHDHVAYERFTADGAIALLPLTDNRVGLIWTLPTDDANQVLQLTDEEFIARLQREFGFRLGRFTRIGRRSSYPLTLTRAEERIAPRLVVIGNAAQGLHPIAGQGFNLGLRDAASLAEVLADAKAESNVSGERAFDAGDGATLARYRAWRGDDQRRIVAFTDGLVRVFGQRLAPVKLLRDLAMLAFDLAPPAKSALAQLSLGAAGRIPRLARGAPLT